MKSGRSEMRERNCRSEIGILFGILVCVKLCISLDFYDEICFSDNKIIELKLTLFYNQIQLQTFHPSYYAVLVTNFASIIGGYGGSVLLHNFLVPRIRYMVENPHVRMRAYHR